MPQLSSSPALILRTVAQMALACCLGLALAACQPDLDLPKLSPEELEELQGQILPTTRVMIRGVDYAVSPITGKPGRYLIRTVGSVPGTRKDAFTALRQLYGCQSARLKELKEPWIRTEATGAFCKDALQ